MVYIASIVKFSLFFVTAILTYFLLITIFFIWLFWLDKRRAQSSSQRVSEISLLCMSGLGANISMFAAQKWLHHKTLKQSFNAKLCVFTALQTSMLISLCYWLFLE
ncbi:DUF1294 domain-containing protein [Pseudoalteromonas sp. A25]|uniref:DUF1294 domain-containing protein n=1 Tax=Pseudoalteromonas sp. A25 TaxID=116092 RepID=UPI003FA6CAD2